MRRHPDGVNVLSGAGRSTRVPSVMHGLLATTLLVGAAGYFAGCGPGADEGDADGGADTTAGDGPVADSLAMPGGANGGAGAGLGEPVLVVDSLAMPESAAPGPDGRWYVSLIGVFGTNDDGAIVAVDASSGAVDTVATGLDDPKGVTFKGDTLYVADVGGVFTVAPGGAVSVFAPASAFPRPPGLLNDVVFDAGGDLLVSDTGSLDGSAHGAIFRVSPSGEVTLVPQSDTLPELGSVNGLASSADGVYAVDFSSGSLFWTDGAGEWRKVVDGLGAGDGLALDGFGRLYVTDHTGGTVLVLLNIAGPGNPFGPDTVASGIEGAADLSIDAVKNRLLVPALRGNRLLVFELP